VVIPTIKVLILINSLSHINHSIVTTKNFHVVTISKLTFASNIQKEKTIFHSIQFDKFFPKVKGIILRFYIDMIIPAFKKIFLFSSTREEINHPQD